jgi:hypothetical protein
LLTLVYLIFHDSKLFSIITIVRSITGDTRGGCLSVKKHEDDGRRAEVIFSYTDRVAELCAQDFLNIILNFVETAVSLRRKLLATTVQVQHHHHHHQEPATATVVVGTTTTTNVLFASSPSSSSSKTSTTTASSITRTTDCDDNSSNKTAAENSNGSPQKRTCKLPTITIVDERERGDLV